MNNESQSHMKDEMMEELSRKLNQRIEQEVEEEVDEELSKQSRYTGALTSFRTYFIAIAATIMALGQFSEAVSLIEDGVDSLRSRFTNTVEYELLSRIHVDNTEAYIEELLGNPQVSKAISEDIVANYFYDEKYLLTLFITDNRVAAYTVIPLREDFRPLVVGEGDSGWELQATAYSSFPANPKLYMVDHSNTTSYYIEALDTGRIGLFVQIYLGNVALTGDGENELIVDLYNSEVTGTQEQALESQTQLRNSLHPNLYGVGRIDLQLVQKSLLTGAEFSSYFGQ